jgi:hypothetical protein
MSKKKNFADIIKDFEGKSYEELLALAMGSMTLIAKAFSKFNDTQPGDIILPFIFTTLGVDGELSETELKFLNDLFASDFDYEATKKYAVAHNDEEIVELVDKLIDMCDGETKAALLVFCLCFAAVDHNVSCQETAYLIKLFA